MNAEATGTSPNPASLRVLIAEDEQGARTGLCAALTKMGHQCTLAEDGRQAWELFQEHRPDVVLSDFRMPHMDGAELCRNVRAATSTTDYTYFILMSAFNDREHLLCGMESGADDYEAKPLDLDRVEAQLVTAVRVLHDHRRVLAVGSAVHHAPAGDVARPGVDVVTGVPNQLRLSDDLEIIWADATRYDRRYCAASVSVDWWKLYATAYGDERANQMLHDIAQLLTQSLRRSDRLYHMGGEDLLVLMSEQHLQDAVHVMNRLRTKVEALSAGLFGAPPLTLSVGIAQRESFDKTPERWLARADRALAAAQLAGRNCVVIDA